MMVQYASLAIAAGTVNTVACVFADVPVSSEPRANDAYDGSAMTRSGFQAARLARSHHRRDGLCPGGKSAHGALRYDERRAPLRVQ